MSEESDGCRIEKRGCGERGEQGERRVCYRLRSVFETVFAMLSPFFDAGKEWVGTSLQHLAFRIVRENFPELTNEEVIELVAAAHRAYIDNNPDCSDHLPRPDELRQLRVRSFE